MKKKLFIIHNIMKDLKIGTKITLEIVEGDTCKDCSISKIGEW